MLVETVVAARWRQRRIWGIQKTNFDYDIASVSSTSENPAQRAVEALRTSDESIRSHELLLRYEIALYRQISRALLRLQQIQDRAANKVAKRDPVPAPAPTVPHSVEPSESAPGAARTSGAEEEPIARRSGLRDSKEVKRTQQPVENATQPNSNSRPAPQPESPANRRPPASQQNTPAKRSVPSI
jgi:hypothetical protein